MFLNHITILFTKSISLSYQFLKFYIRDENIDTNLKFLILRKFHEPIIYLTNKFHVAVRLFSNRSQMTSKCGKGKQVEHEAIAEKPAAVVNSGGHAIRVLNDKNV